MARVKRIPDVFARITVPYASVANAFVKIRQSADRIIVYEHNEREDNIHIHFLVEGNQLSTDTLKNYFKGEGFTPDPRGRCWSFTRADDRKCITYMSKGHLNPIYCDGFDDEEINGYKNAWVPQKGQQLMTRYVVKETVSEAKKRKYDMVQDMLNRLKGHHFQNMSLYADEKVVQVVLDVLHANKVCFNRFTFRDYYDTVCSQGDKDNFVSSMVKFLTPK